MASTLVEKSRFWGVSINWHDRKTNKMNLYSHDLLLIPQLPAVPTGGTGAVADYRSPIVVKWSQTFLLRLFPTHRYPFTSEAHTKLGRRQQASFTVLTQWKGKCLWASVPEPRLSIQKKKKEENTFGPRFWRMIAQSTSLRNNQNWGQFQVQHYIKDLGSEGPLHPVGLEWGRVWRRGLLGTSGGTWPGPENTWERLSATPGRCHGERN